MASVKAVTIGFSAISAKSTSLIAETLFFIVFILFETQQVSYHCDCPNKSHLIQQNYSMYAVSVLLDLLAALLHITISHKQDKNGE